MNTKELLEKICSELQNTKTDEWSKVELKCDINLMEHFEPTDTNDAFVGCDQYRYPKDAKTYGVEIFVDGKCVFREYDIIKANESDIEAESRIAQQAIINIGSDFIKDRIKLSKDFILYP